jgi:outer membrane protein
MDVNQYPTWSIKQDSPIRQLYDGAVSPTRVLIYPEPLLYSLLIVNKLNIPFHLTPLLLAALLVVSTDAGAGTVTADHPVAVGTQAMTLVQFTDLALQHNPRTRSGWAAIRASEAGVELARAGYWPQLDVALTGQRNRSLNFSGQPANIQTRYGASVSLSYLLWDFGARSGTLKQGKFELISAQLTQDQNVQDVMLQVEQAYYQVLGLQAVVEVNRQSLKDAQTNLDAAQDRRAFGLATVGDVYKAEAAMAGARLAVQQTEGQLASARGSLASAIGESPDTMLPLAAWEDLPTPEMPVQSVASLMDDARNARPELLAAKALEQSAAAKVTATRGSGLPTLNFDANAGRTRVQDVGDSSQFSALLTLKIPLFAGFGDRAAIRQAEAGLDSARANSDDLRSQVELQVWQSYQNLLTASATLESSAAQLKSATLAADVSNARYKSGFETILDVLISQNTLANARVQQVQARLDWAAARTALGHAVGGLKLPATTHATTRESS